MIETDPTALTLILGQVGSKAYGTDTLESDDDFMGVILAPMSCYIGLDSWGQSGTKESKRENGSPVDAVYYDIKKFFNLCLGFNPNVIPLLYLQKYVHVSPGGQMILSNADMFTSKLAFDTFIGYSKSQLSSVQRGVTGKYGEKRKALIQKYGYDVKFAYHTIRLLTMIQEFFSIGLMNVHRGADIPYLMSIREGKVKQEEFFKLAEDLMHLVGRCFDDAKWIPDKPDYERANRICMDVIDSYALKN